MYGQIMSWFTTCFTHGFFTKKIPKFVIEIFDIFLTEGEVGFYGILIMIFESLQE